MSPERVRPDHHAGRPDDADSLPRQLTGRRSPLIWGVVLLVLIEATLLCLWVVSYLYLRLGLEAWPPPGVAPPDLLPPAIGQILLLLSPLPVWMGLRAVREGRVGHFLRLLPLGMFLAAAYLGLKIREYAVKDHHWTIDAYGSLDWSMSGYAALHVIVVLLAGTVVWALALGGHVGTRRYTGVEALLIYWLFVALGSLLFFGVQYLVPIL